MPKLEAIDRRAITRAAKGLAPRVRRRGLGFVAMTATETGIRRFIEEMLLAVEDDDLPPRGEEDLGPWVRVEASGLVLVGVGERAYIVARVAARGGRAARLLRP